MRNGQTNNAELQSNDQVELPLGRGFAVDLVEEADEFLMPVARHALADDPAVEQIEGSE
jgi:hypothetical protein